MDTDRVQSYLKMACAGLGFDVGEVWISRNKKSTRLSSIAHDSKFSYEIKEGEGGSALGNKIIRFLQLYTSKSYTDKRCNLLSPPSDFCQTDLDDSTSIEKHVLSPRLVDAVLSSMQVVWANCQRQEGFLGRSDMCLQTAVGMPVAVDSVGNTCIVIMFSRNNVQSNEDAMEYLQFISKSATSHSIPCLLPVVGYEADEIQPNENMNRDDLVCDMQSSYSSGRGNTPDIANSSNVFPEGVTARFVPLGDKFDRKNMESDKQSSISSNVEVHSVHDLKAAPKDCFGIPMLPSFAELGGGGEDDNKRKSSIGDAFDEASYGVWNIIMDNSADNFNFCDPDEVKSTYTPQDNSDSKFEENSFSRRSSSSTLSNLSTKSEQIMPQLRIDRLEEFSSAFLGMSVFDIADVWLPSSIEDFNSLVHVTTVAGNNSSDDPIVEEFKEVSSCSTIKIWSGAVGRAFGSGNPVWSSNQNVIIDSRRSEIFKKTKIKSVLAVPVYSAGGNVPACVVSCYSFVRIDSVPYVLRFVQQALRLLWEGLDRVVPNSSEGKDLWKEVAPADLGEMAADIEMQKAFLVKKRPHDSISVSTSTENLKVLCETKNMYNEVSPTMKLSTSMQSLTLPSEDTNGSSPQQKDFVNDNSNTSNYKYNKVKLNNSITKPDDWSNSGDQNHVRTANMSIGQSALHSYHKAVSTNLKGTKRAHMVASTENIIGGQKFVAKTNEERKYEDRNVQPQHSSTKNCYQASTQDHQRLYYENGAQYAPRSNAESNAKDYIGNLRSFQPQCMNLNDNETVPQSNGNIFDSNLRPGNPSSLPGFNRQSHSKASTGKNSETLPQTKPLFSPFSSNPKMTHPFSFNGHARHECITIAHVDHSNAAHDSKQRQPSVMPNNRREHPEVAIRNIAELNAMLAQRKGPPMNNNNVSPEKGNWTTKISPPPSNSSYNMPTSGLTSKVFAIDAKPDSNSPILCSPINSKAPPPINTKMRKVCRIQGCDEVATARRPYCPRHSGHRLCEHTGCSKCAQGATRFCIAHGGGRRCKFPGCDKGARDKFFCAAHGGGKRCKIDGCTKSAVGGSHLCTSHGGGKRCSVDGCVKSAQSSTRFCVKHGGGKKCVVEGCEKVARGKTLFCAAHGGGVRCKLDGCNRVAVGKLQLCRRHGGGFRPS